MNYYKIFVTSKDQRYDEVFHKHFDNKEEVIEAILDKYSINRDQLLEYDFSDFDFEILVRNEYEAYHDIEDNDLLISIEDHGGV